MDVYYHPSPPPPRKSLPLFAQHPRPPSSDPQNVYYAEGRIQLMQGEGRGESGGNQEMGLERFI